MDRHEKKLLDRVRAHELEKRKRHASAALWEGEYGYGAGRAHPSVEFATCPSCGSVPGRLCIGPRGPIFSIHSVRGRAFAEMKKAVYEKLAKEAEKEQQATGGKLGKSGSGA